jgi:hypothetical protein
MRVMSGPPGGGRRRGAAERGEDAVELGVVGPGQHRDAEGAQGRTGRGPVQPPQPQRQFGVGRTRDGGRLVAERVHHDQGEAAPAQVGQRGQAARVEQR